MSVIKVNKNQVKIGSVELDNPVVSAPMAGVSDKPFRLLAESAGCGLICTEMISANALHYNSERTIEMLDLTGEKGPTSVQIFGNEPGFMADAAKFVIEHGADIVDINMGCPAPKVVKNQEGCALMKDPNRARQIIESVVKSCIKPITVKFRKGWDEDNINVVEMARMAQECGAAAVTVHGRTRDQFYSGHADWDIIGEVKAVLEIPVIGNGDIFTPEDALRMIEHTSCNGVMIGRGSMGNPWLFERTVHYLRTGELLPEPTVTIRMNTAIRHLLLAQKYKGESRAVKEMRKHIAWYIKGLHNAAKVREEINKTENTEEIIKILRGFTN